MRKFTWLLALAVPMTIISCQKDAVQAPSSQEEGALVQAAGNGAPSGAHYNLNIIGVKNPKEFNVDEYGNTSGNGRRIFVPLQGNCRINLAPGSFDVLDADGTDGVAQFQLPNPDENNDGVTTYSVWARSLGKPGGSVKATTCMEENTDVDGDGIVDTYCSVGSYVDVRERGKQSFTDVSKYLLYVYADLDGDGDQERTPIFGDAMYDYYWQWENSNLKLCQLRFYNVPSEDIPATL